jgi:ATP-dependent DNA helicase DinG
MKEISQALEERLSQLLSEKQMKEQTLAFIEEMYSFLEDWRLLRENLAVFAGQNGGDENVVWVEGDLRALEQPCHLLPAGACRRNVAKSFFFAKKECRAYFRDIDRWRKLPLFSGRDGAFAHHKNGPHSVAFPL